MSYTKTNWTKGDVITAEKLNKMEDGIEQAGSGSGGGDGGYSPRIIDIRSLSPTATMNYEPGLEMADFVGAQILASEGGSDVMTVVNTVGEVNSSVMMTAALAGQSMITLVYVPEGQIGRENTSQS